MGSGVSFDVLGGGGGRGGSGESSCKDGGGGAVGGGVGDSTSVTPEDSGANIV